MSDISVSTRNNTGLIYLKRPQALNALTMDMCAAIETALSDWRDDNQIQQVILYAEGERAFCAGGDVAALYHMGKDGKIDQINAFWREEYRMNSFIAHYPKPVIAMMQGYVMGGGVGIGCHASHRIICETTKLAMPECAIGLVPDVGGSYLLARTKGHIGEYMALTGARINPADILATGFADYHIRLDKWETLRSEIIEHNTLDVIDALSPVQLRRLHSLSLIEMKLTACLDNQQLAILARRLRQAKQNLQPASKRPWAGHRPCPWQVFSRLSAKHAKQIILIQRLTGNIGSPAARLNMQTSLKA